MAPVDEVARDLAELTRHAEWATEFFDGPIEAIEGGEYVATVPRMGGRVHMRVDAHIATGAIDMYIAPEAEPFGPALPIRVIPNLDGCDVLFTLSRFLGHPTHSGKTACAQWIASCSGSQIGSGAEQEPWGWMGSVVTEVDGLALWHGETRDAFGVVVDPLQVGDHVDLQAICGDPIGLIRGEASGLMGPSPRFVGVHLALHLDHLARAVVIAMGSA